MKRAAVLAGGAVVLLVVLAAPASAECVDAGSGATVHVCSDANGNGIPDEMAVETPLGGASYDEPACGDCQAPSDAQAELHVDDVMVGVDGHCNGPPSPANLECEEFGGEVMVGNDGVDATVRSDGVKLWACMKVKTTAVVIIKCGPVPEL